MYQRVIVRTDLWINIHGNLRLNLLYMIFSYTHGQMILIWLTLHSITQVHVYRLGKKAFVFRFVLYCYSAADDAIMQSQYPDLSSHCPTIADSGTNTYKTGLAIAQLCFHGRQDLWFSRQTLLNVAVGAITSDMQVMQCNIIKYNTIQDISQ